MNLLVLLHRELLIQSRSRGLAALPVVFFVVITFVFALGIGADESVLEKAGIGIVWITALFSCILALENLFVRDMQDGTLELMLLHSDPLFANILVKVFAHWLSCGLPIVVLCPLVAWILHIDWHVVPLLAGSLLLSTWIFVLVGAIGSAMTLYAERSGMLVTLLVVPLSIGALLLGAGACYSAAMGVPSLARTLALLALFSATTTLAPFIISALLRAGQEY